MLSNLIFVNLIGFDTSLIQLSTLCEKGNIFWLFVVSSGMLGTSFSEMLLNGNTRLFIDLQEFLFGKLLYGKKSFGTVTIFCGDTLIATTVLGLYLVSGVLERHGGLVWCESNKENGTGYYMKVPISVETAGGYDDF